MVLFTDYVQPLTSWLYSHPEWALFITFLISFSESLAIVGSIIPGSVTMTAIGILADSGVMRIDLTLYAAILGAIAGDSGSYLLGYVFSDRLAYIWPFKRYPKWLKYGNEYFNRHGGKSVLIGRFAGPLRSIIPVIAGMMRMHQWHFFLANAASAVAWSMLYVMPGVLIGAASSELSAEAATRLFVLILVGLVIIWLAGQGIKWLFIRLRNFIQAHLETFGDWAKNHPRMSKSLKALKSKNDRTFYPSITLIALFLFCCLGVMLLSLLSAHSAWVNTMNHGVSFFLQSFRIHAFDNLFIVISLILSPLSFLVFITTTTLVTIYYKNWPLVRYWIGLAVTTIALTIALNMFIISPSSANAFKHPALFIPIHLTVSTSMLCFLMLYFKEQRKIILMRIIFSIIALSIIILSSFASLYLSDSWLSNVLIANLIGVTIGLLFWIAYRHHDKANNALSMALLISCFTFIPMTGIQYARHFNQLMNQHYLSSHHYNLAHDAWWNQKNPVLPIYTTNRLGQNTGIFNIQYAGSIQHLSNALTNRGWEEQSNSFLYSLIMRAKMQSSTRHFPLIAELYLNKKPVLTMTYQSTINGDFYLLRLWRSNYYLEGYSEPLWIGSIIHPREVQMTKIGEQKSAFFAKYFLPALTDFTHRKLLVKLPAINKIPASSHELLIIDDPRHGED